MKMGPVILLRHGETRWNVQGRVQGHRDSPLTERGRAQAAAQGRLLAPVLQRFPGARVLCSPLGRARATATIALRGTGKPIRLDARLAEVSAGEWEGLLRDDLRALYSQSHDIASEFDLFLSAPGGERFEAVQARCQSFLDALVGPTIAITHGVTSMMIRGLMRGLSRTEMEAQSRDQGCLYLVQGGAESILSEHP